MALTPSQIRRRKLNMLMAMSYAVARGSTSLSGAAYLLQNDLTGLAIDFLDSSLVIKNFDDARANYSGRPFAPEGGPVSFTRASNATVVDSDGVIKWAPHNLLANSESFDASSWTKSFVATTANSIAAPNGTTTADTLASTSSASSFTGAYINISSFAVGTSPSMAVFAKAGTSSIAFLCGDAGQAYGVFNLSTGAVIASANCTASATALGGGWYYLVIANMTVTPTLAVFGGKSAYTSGDPWYTGTWTSGNTIYLWGAHLYRSDLGGMQANASAYPMYNPTTPKNLLGQSEAFDVSPWATGLVGTGVNPVVTANAGVAPNGLQTADRIQFSLAGGTTTTDISRRTQQFSTISGIPYTFSMWVKSYDGNPYTMHLVGAGGLTSNIVSVTNEWQRVSVTANAAGGTVSFAIGLRGGQATVNSNTADILVWGAQLSDSASLDAYVPSYGAAPTSAAYYGPRRDFDPVTLACKGLLIEEQRSNLLLNSATLSTQNVTVTAVAHTLSFYGTGTVTLSGTSTAGPLVGTGASNRVSLTFTPTAGTLTLTVSGSVTQAQLEAGSFATSYIPTGASTATRTADVASVSTQAFPYSQTEGSLMLNLASLSSAVTGGNFAVLSAGDSANDRIALARTSASQSLFRVAVSGSTQFSLNNTIGSGSLKIGAAFAASDFAVIADGGVAQTSSSGSMPSNIDKLHIGKYPTGSGDLNGHIRQITYLPRRLSNAELQARTV